MADDIQLNLGTGGDMLAAHDAAGVKHQRVKMEIDVAGTPTEVDAAHPLPVTGPLTDTELRNTAVPVSGTITASGPLTDTELRDTPVPVTGPLTDTQLRNSAVPVSTTALPLPTGASTSALQGGGLPDVLGAGGGLKVEGSGTAIPVTGPLTDTQLRNTAVPVSATTLPLPTDAATSAKQDTSETTLGTIHGHVESVDTKMSGGLPTALGTGGGLKVEGSGTAIPVSGPLTDTQLRNTAVPVSGSFTDGGAGKTLSSASFSLSATGHAVPLVAGKRIKVYAVKLIVSAAISVNFRSGASTDLEGAQAIAANGGFTESVNPPAFLFATAAGEDLDLVISGTGTAAGRVSYWADDAT